MAGNPWFDLRPPGCASPTAAPLLTSPPLPVSSQVLNRLARLGHHYRSLRRFAESSASPRPRGGPPGLGRPSLYRAALGGGLDEALGAYEAAVLQLEQEALGEEADQAWQREVERAAGGGAGPAPEAPASPSPSALPLRLASLQRALAPFERVLPQLSGFVAEVLSRDLAGGRLLMALRRRAVGGVAPVGACFHRLLWHTHAAFFRQLSAWVVYGELLDPHHDTVLRAGCRIQSVQLSLSLEDNRTFIVEGVRLAPTSP